MSSNVAITIQYLKEQENERYRDLFHTMFKKVNDKIKADVHYQLPRGIYYSSIRLPSVPAFSGFTTKPTPPQDDVDAYIIRQLEKRNFKVTKQDAHYIQVDWSTLVSTTTPSTCHTTKQDYDVPIEEKRNKEKAISMLPQTDTSMLLPPLRPLPPPSRSSTQTAPSVAAPAPKPTMKTDLKKPIKKPSHAMKSIPKNVPILSNKVPRLDPQIEKKMAASHQSVLRALAGV